MNRRRSSGMVLVAVLVVTLATWALLAAILTSAFLHYRLASGAERSAVAGAAADRWVAEVLAEARGGHAAAGAWPAARAPSDEGKCALTLVETHTAEAWWRVRVRADFEGATAWREGTAHAAP